MKLAHRIVSTVVSTALVVNIAPTIKAQNSSSQPNKPYGEEANQLKPVKSRVFGVNPNQPESELQIFGGGDVESDALKGGAYATYVGDDIPLYVHFGFSQTKVDINSKIDVGISQTEAHIGYLYRTDQLGVAFGPKFEQTGKTLNGHSFPKNAVDRSLGGFFKAEYRPLNNKYFAGIEMSLVDVGPHTFEVSTELGIRGLLTKGDTTYIKVGLHNATPADKNSVFMNHLTPLALKPPKGQNGMRLSVGPYFRDVEDKSTDAGVMVRLQLNKGEFMPEKNEVFTDLIVQYDALDKTVNGKASIGLRF